MSYLGLLPHTCDIENRVDDKWGEGTGTPTTGVKCRWEHGNKIVKNFKGEDVLSTALVFFKKTAIVRPSSRLRASSTDRWHSVLNIQQPSDLHGIHHIEVSVE